MERLRIELWQTQCRESRRVFRKRMDRTFDCKPRLQESSPALPAQPETPHAGHLAGLLTYASGELETPSRVISPIHANIRRERGPSQWPVVSSSQRLQLRGSGGFSPRFPLPDGEKL